MSKFVFPAPISRRAPDPVHKEISRHILFVPVRGVPKGLPFDPNARIPNLNRRVYRDLKKSLLNDGVLEDGMFHLKHKGITLVAEKVEQKDDSFVVTMKNGHGVLDGGHTYDLITTTPPSDLPEQQFVKFEILTHVPEEWIAEIAGGLNTSVQVQPMSLDNLRGDFEWVKGELTGESYYDQIAWKENQDGEFDARDLVSLMTLFNIRQFPNDSSNAQPVVAYEKKSQALRLFEEDPKSYKKVRPLLKDILILHDTIRRDSRQHWNENGGQFGKFKFVEERQKGEFEFPFTGKTAKYRLTNGALYPMLAAFRWMVEEKAGKFCWRGGFARVIERWEGSAEELLRMTVQAHTELGRNPNAIGKSRNHWANLHARVAMRDLMAKK